MFFYLIKTIKILTVFVALSFTIINLNAHSTDSKGSKVYKSKKLTENIFMLQGKGGNIVLLSGKDGLLMIDDDYKDLSVELKKEIEHHGKVENLQYLINTHWHGDHTGGNFELGEFTKIVSHINVRKRLETTQEVKLFKMVSKPYPKKALPSITYNDTLNIHFNDEEINVIHYAYGHTDGDSVVWFKKANIVHMGDLYFSNMFPFVDVGTGGDVLQLAKNIRIILNKIDDSTVVVPGHGKLSTKKELYEYYLMLVGTYNEINHMVSNDISQEDIKKRGLGKKWDQWNKGFLKKEVWVDIIYDSIVSNDN